MGKLFAKLAYGAAGFVVLAFLGQLAMTVAEYGLYGALLLSTLLAGLPGVLVQAAGLLCLGRIAVLLEERHEAD